MIGNEENPANNPAPKEDKRQKRLVTRKSHTRVAHPEVDDRILALAKEGKTNAEIAESIGKPVRTLYRWKAEDLELASRIRDNQEEANGLVEASAFKRCTGYDYTEEGVFQGVPVTVKRHAPPDATLIKYWLNNRSSEKWKEKAEQVHRFAFGEEVESGRGTTKI